MNELFQANLVEVKVMYHTGCYMEVLMHLVVPRSEVHWVPISFRTFRWKHYKVRSAYQARYTISP